MTQKATDTINQLVEANEKKDAENAELKEVVAEAVNNYKEIGMLYVEEESTGYRVGDALKRTAHAAE